MSASSADESPSEVDRKPKKIKALPVEKTAKEPKAKRAQRSYTSGFSFGSNNLYAPAESSEEPTKNSAAKPSGRTSAKRSLTESEQEDQPPSRPIFSRLPLLPPSPPPADSEHYVPKTKFKSAATSRKKAKLAADSEEHEEDDSSEENDHVEVRDWTWQKQGIHARDTGSDLDLDPILRLGVPSASGPSNDPASTEPGEFDVNLPDHLRRVLAISPSKARDPNEEGVVKGLLTGSRVLHYDAARGGDVWDVGEIGDGTEGEEDWEGEPVPWEMGEL